ncbi:MAG: toprim domain-containing protein [Nanoarchaeota archaeon]
MFATREEIEEIIEKIKQEIEEQKIIILVEGKKDKAALETFQLKDIIILNGKDIWNRLEALAQEHKGKEVLILTDFDSEGKKLYGKITKDLERLGMRVNKKYREFFQKRTKLSHVEGLGTYAKNQE